jgi:hypothetical protein
LVDDLDLSGFQQGLGLKRTGRENPIGRLDIFTGARGMTNVAWEEPLPAMQSLRACMKRGYAALNKESHAKTPRNTIKVKKRNPEAFCLSVCALYRVP